MRLFETDSRAVEKISITEFNRILSQAQAVLEQDQLGIKVVELANGEIFKVFRVKRWWSSANVYSYAQRFSRNVYRLKQRNVPVPTMKALYRVSGTRLTAVQYAPLAGDTIKDLTYQQQLTADIAYQVGQFIAYLHDIGIYFRGLHIGNIVRIPTAELGLIDVSELSIYAYSLGPYRRLRNFTRFWRNQQDKQAFGETNTHQLIAGYLSACKTIGVTIQALQKRLV